MGWTCEICGMVSKERASGRSLAVHQQFNSDCLKIQKEGLKEPEVIKETSKRVFENPMCDGCQSDLNQTIIDENDSCPYCGEAF